MFSLNPFWDVIQRNKAYIMMNCLFMPSDQNASSLVSCKKCSTIIQCSANKIKLLLEKFTKYKRKRSKCKKTIKQSWLFRNRGTWNLGYIQLFMVWIFLQLFFTKTFVVEIAQLHDSLAMERVWIEIDTPCTLTLQRVFESIVSDNFQLL